MSFDPRLHASSVINAIGRPTRYISGSTTRLIRSAVHRKGERLPFSTFREFMERTRVHVLKTDVTEPVVGDGLIIDDVSYTVQAVLPLSGESDPYQTRWSLEVEWGPLVTLTEGSTFDGNATVAGDTAAGQSSLALHSVPAEVSSITRGDSLVLSPYSDVYTVQNTTTVVSGSVSGVAFSPALTQSVANGSPVRLIKGSGSVTFNAPVFSLNVDAIKDSAVSGTQARVLALAASLNGSVPVIGSRVTLNGAVLAVKGVSQLYIGPTLYGYELRVGA